jgi:RNA polymerase sigma-70 factor (sigma-E family)
VDFEQLVLTRYAGLRRAALVLTDDQGHADDLVQTVLAKAHRHWSKVQRADNVDAYLHTMLVNTARSWRTRRWTGELPVADVLPQQAQRDGTAAVDLQLALMTALRSLPPAQRAVLVLRYLADLDERATALALRCSIGTVKSRTSRALTTLRTSGLLDDDLPRRRTTPHDT